MKLGFSTLSLFMLPITDMFEKAKEDGFSIVEILCEGPYMPRCMLENKDEINFKNLREIAESYEIEVFLHGPTVDLNPASMNMGIREESRKQINETLEIADLFNAKAITTHPGVVHRREKRIRDLAIGYSIETFKDCQEFAEDLGIILSIENMPSKFSYLGNTPEELSYIVEEVGSHTTIDWGHSNTYKYPKKFLKVPNICYFHLNDNEGEKDQHLNLGEGTANWDKKFLKKIEYGIIELNNYENVLKARDFIENKLK